MATSVLLACGLNEARPPTFTLLREETDVDASFLVACVLGQRTKVQSAGTVLLCLHHRFQHYVAAGHRLAFNLQAARDKGTLRVLDPLAGIGDNGDLFDNEYLSAGSEELLAKLWLELRQQVAELSGGRKSVTIVLDDAATLVDLAVPERLVLRFCRQLVQWAAQASQDASTVQLSVVIKLSSSNLYEHMANNLDALANLQVQCIRLCSGNFREVDGRLSVTRRTPKGSNDEVTSTPSKSMLYKVNERNVKIFAPGEVGIRI